MGFQGFLGQGQLQRSARKQGAPNATRSQAGMQPHASLRHMPYMCVLRACVQASKGQVYAMSMSPAGVGANMYGEYVGCHLGIGWSLGAAAGACDGACGLQIRSRSLGSCIA